MNVDKRMLQCWDNLGPRHCWQLHPTWNLWSLRGNEHAASTELFGLFLFSGALTIVVPLRPHRKELRYPRFML